MRGPLHGLRRVERRNFHLQESEIPLTISRSDVFFCFHLTVYHVSLQLQLFSDGGMGFVSILSTRSDIRHSTDFTAYGDQVPVTRLSLSDYETVRSAIVFYTSG